MNIQAKHLITLLFASALFACEGENGSGSTESQYEQPQAWAESPLCGLSYVPTEVGEVGVQDLAVRNEGNQSLQITGASFLDDTDGVFSAQVGKDNADYKDSALVRVSFSPTAAGWARARLVIESNAQNYPRLIIPVLALAYPEGGDPDTYTPGAKPTREDDTTELCPAPADDGTTGD